MIHDISELVEIASGRKKAGLVLKNVHIVNVFTQEIQFGDIAVSGNRIAGIGSYSGVEEVDLNGKYAVPGLIDGHMHLESSMVRPSEFARAVVPRGTTTVIADPHEIANVCGLEGVRYLLDSSRDILLDVFFMLPSCVPATPFDSPGASFGTAEMKKLMDDKRVLGLGEVMDYNGVAAAQRGLLDKIELFDGRIIDGHAPGLRGMALNAYAAAGIKTDHECGEVDEMLEKLRLGLYVLIREGSAAKDLSVLIKGVNSANMRRCVFCTDDRQLEDIIKYGHIDNNIRVAVKNGVSPVSAITMATLNTAECYGLKDRGAIAPGYAADIVVLDDLDKFIINSVYKNGRPVGRQEQHKPAFIPAAVANTVRIKPVDEELLNIKMDTPAANIIEIMPGSIVTKKTVREVTMEDGRFVCRKSSDPVKLAVIERHKATGRIGLGLLDNFGLRGGAIASTVSHDSHNIIVAGDNDRDMLAAINEINKNGGGITICSGGGAVRSLPLDIAGLISSKPYEEVCSVLGEMLGTARNMGVPADMDPFMTLSFLALTVIPEIRLTDRGLFDVSSYSFINVS